MSDQPDEQRKDDSDAMTSRIVIKDSGEVIIENLSMDLMELALLLDPDVPVGCQLDPDEDPTP